jgi:hypothetical protein
MKSFLLPIGIVVLAAACTTLKPVAAPRDEIQRQIMSGALLKAGDKIRLVTSDGATHDLTVASVDPGRGVVAGEIESVRVADIASLEKRRFRALQTSLLAAGAFVGVGLLTVTCENNCNSGY